MAKDPTRRHANAKDVSLSDALAPSLPPLSHWYCMCPSCMQASSRPSGVDLMAVAARLTKTSV